MRPQTLGITIACTVTAVFMAAVGFVALKEYLPTPDERGPQPGPVAFFNTPQVQIAPLVLALVLLFRRSVWGVVAAVPLFAFWLLIMGGIWLFLLA